MKLCPINSCLLVILTLSVAVAKNCNTGFDYHIIGANHEHDPSVYKNSLQKKLGNGPKVFVQGYRWNRTPDDNGIKLANYDDKNAEQLMYSSGQPIITKDKSLFYALGVKPKESENPDYEITEEDILRYDFGGLVFHNMTVTVSNLFNAISGFSTFDESAMYRGYRNGQKILEYSLNGKDSGIIKADISSVAGFDTLEFSSSPNALKSRFLVSYLEYCAPTTCTGNTAMWYGATHITSFDGLNWDCQGSGHFLVFQGIKGDAKRDFQIQAIFDDTKAQNQISVTHDVVIDSGVDGAPIIQVSVAESDDESRCTYNVYNDKTKIDYNNGFISTGVVLSIIEGRNGHPFKTLVFDSVETGTQVTIDMATSTVGGCFLGVSVCLGEYWNDPQREIRGLLGGKSNSNVTDDWVKRDGIAVADGVNVTDLTGKSAYEFCVQNWCIQDEGESLFTYDAGQSFSQFDKCKNQYDGSIENEVGQIEKNPEYQDIVVLCKEWTNGTKDELHECYLEAAVSKAGGGNATEGAIVWHACKEKVTESTDTEGYYNDLVDNGIDVDIAGTETILSIPQPARFKIGDIGDFIDQNGCTVSIDISIDKESGLRRVSTVTNCEDCNCPTVSEQHLKF